MKRGKGKKIGGEQACECFWSGCGRVEGEREGGRERRKGRDFCC